MKETGEREQPLIVDDSAVNVNVSSKDHEKQQKPPRSKASVAAALCTVILTVPALIGA